MSIVSLADECREVQASEILKQIESGEDVNLTDCRIIGELNLSEIQLETVPNPRYSELLEFGYFDEVELENYGVNKDLKVVESNITICNSIFEDDLDFSSTLFKESLSLVDASFSSSANFICTSFGDGTNFYGASFGDGTNFYGASFGDGANFYGASFGDGTNFYGASFGDGADFEYSSFGDDTDFGYSSFGDDTDFDETSFGDNAYFGGISFGDNADFRMVSFGDYSGFGEANFDNDAWFSWTIFGDDTDFGYSSFGNGADFDETSFGDNAYFGGVNFGDDVNFRMASFGDYSGFEEASFGDGADFEETSFGDGADFEGASFADTVYFLDTEFKTISLNNTDFKEMQISWNSLENSLVFDGPTYVKLIQNFRNLEQFDDADAAYFQYRKYCQTEKPWIPFSKEGSKWCDILMWFTCGYGVKPFRAFYLGGLIVLLFSFIYLGSPTISWCNREEIDNTQKSVIKTVLSLIPKINWSNPGISRLSDSNGSVQKVTFWDSFYFSMVTFSTIGFGDWYPKDSFRKWVMLEGLFGWITLSLFLVTLTNVMIRP